MSATYIYGSGLTRVQGCIEQPGTRLRKTESGLEVLTYSFKGEPDSILALLSTYGPGTTPPIVGSWSNFRVIECGVTQSDGVWSMAEFQAKGLMGSAPQPNVRWSKSLKTIQNATYLGTKYAVLYYLSPTATITRAELIEGGNLTQPTPSSPDFPGGLNVQLLTQTGFVDVNVVTSGGGSNFRACTAFNFSQSGIYWEIEETHEILVPQPPSTDG